MGRGREGQLISSRGVDSMGASPFSAGKQIEAAPAVVNPVVGIKSRHRKPSDGQSPDVPVLGDLLQGSGGAYALTHELYWPMTDQRSD